MLITPLSLQPQAVSTAGYAGWSCGCGYGLCFQHRTLDLWATLNILNMHPKTLKERDFEIRNPESNKICHRSLIPAKWRWMKMLPSCHLLRETDWLKPSLHVTPRWLENTWGHLRIPGSSNRLATPSSTTSPLAIRTTWWYFTFSCCSVVLDHVAWYLCMTSLWVCAEKHTIMHK